MKTRMFGLTLVELMIGLTISTALFLALSILFQLSKQTFRQLSIASDFHANGFQMLEYLRLNIQTAGAGIVHPAQAPPQSPLLPYGGDCGCGAFQPAGITSAVFQGWTYIGYYVDGGASGPRVLPHPVGTSFTPSTCASQTAISFPNAYYCGVQCNSECWAASDGFDKTTLVQDYTGSFATACSGEPVHNCGGCARNDIYQQLVPHINVIPNSQYPTKGDLLTITFAVRSGNNVTDCLGNPISPSGNPATTVPVLVSNSFRVSNNNILQCQSSVQTNGVWNVTPASPTATWTDIIPNVEYLRVMVGVNDNLGYSSGSSGRWGYPATVNRYVAPTQSSPPPLDVNRILSVRLGLVVRSSDNILKTPNTQAITVFPSTNITYPAQSDLLQRKLFVTTIFFNAYNLPAYPNHCVQGSTTYYIKVGGVPWINGALSCDRCAANQTPSCYTYGTFDSCEAVRYGISGANFGATVPH